MGPYRYQGPSSGGVGHERGATILESLPASEANPRGMTTRTPPPGDDDPNAFRRAMAGVRPLPGAPPPRRGRARERSPGSRAPRARTCCTKAMRLRPIRPCPDAGEELTFRRAVVRDEVLRKLQRGQFAVEAEIDLHGLRPARGARGAAAVHERLRASRPGLRARHSRQGPRSGPGGPVLKLVVNHWLRMVETSRRSQPRGPSTAAPARSTSC